MKPIADNPRIALVAAIEDWLDEHDDYLRYHEIEILRPDLLAKQAADYVFDELLEVGEA